MAAQIQAFCHLFWLMCREEHFAKKAIINWVEEMNLRRDTLLARICHLVNMAKCTKTLRASGGGACSLVPYENLQLFPCSPKIN